MSNTLTPNNSPRVRRRGSTRRPRAASHLPPHVSLEAHNAALDAIRNYLKGRTSYDTFPVSFRLIVLDSKLEVKKALQCLLLNGILTGPCSLGPLLTSPSAFSQAWFRLLYGTAKSPASRACSPSQISYISSSITTNVLPTTLLPRIWRPSGWSLCEVCVFSPFPMRSSSHRYRY